MNSSNSGGAGSYRQGFLLSVAWRLRPDLETLGTPRRIVALRETLQPVYAAPLVAAMVVWLGLRTDLASFERHWPELLLFLVLRFLAGQIDLAAIWNSGDHGGSSAARLVVWPAVMVFGPLALWVDLAGVLFEATLAAWRHSRAGTAVQSRFWPATRRSCVTLIRDTLPALAALELYQLWGGVIPVEPFATENVTPALYAVLVKLLLSIATLTPLFLLEIAVVDPPRGRLSRLIASVAAARYWSKTLLYLALLDAGGFLAAGLYTQNGLWLFLFFVATALLTTYVASRLIWAARENGKRSHQLAKMEQLARAMLVQPAESPDLPRLLETFLPSVFEEFDLEIRLGADNVLYRQGSFPSPPGQGLWEELAGNPRATAILPGLPSACLVPIRNAESREAVGAILARPPETKGEITDCLPMLETLAEQISAAIQKSEQHDRALALQAEAFQSEVYARTYEAEMSLAYEQIAQELALAGQIQASFLPEEMPDLDGWQLTTTLEPARETSGDYYDVIPLSDGRLGLLIADVADKGIGAALYMALSRTLIRTYALEYDSEPARVLQAANRRVLADTQSDLFVTVFFAVVEPESGRVTYCNAGHNPPLLWQPGSEVQVHALTRTALPLGVLEETEWEQAVIEMAPGDVLTLYTDGVTEAQNEDGDFYGDERLHEVIRANLGRPAEIIEDKVLSSVFDFAGDAPQFDDITLMVLIRNARRDLPGRPSLG